MAKPIPCNVCGSEKTEFVVVGRDLWLRKPGEFQVVRCAECGLVFLNPQPGPEELADYYPTTYYSFRTKTKGAGTSWRKRLSQRWKDRRDNAGLPRGRPGWRALDVGCGAGGFLATLVAYGWDAYGVEPFEGGRIAQERGLPVHHGTVASAGYPEHHFHFIRLRHVLEHTPDPRALLASLAPILAPEGRIQIVVPNYAGLNARLFGKYWESLDVPRHLFHFRREDVARLAAQAGLEVTKVTYRRSHFKSSLRYLLADRPSGRARWLAPLGGVAARLLSLVSRTRLGDEMTIWLAHARRR